jgi:hypothetical protein
MKYVFSMTLALALLASAPALAEDSIDVMTQNQYLGADLDPLVAGPPDFNQAVIDALSMIAENDISARSQALGEVIAKRLPELVGVQEMFRFECYDLAAPTSDMGCNDPRIANAFPVDEVVEITPGFFVARSVNDHLDLTREALMALEEPYEAAATVENLDLSDVYLPPGFPPIPGIPVDLSVPPDGLPEITVTILDRDVILARGDIAEHVAPLNPDLVATLCSGRVSEDGCNYEVVASTSAPPPINDITILRGWVAVDYTNDDTTYRFVNTHLEVQHLVDIPVPPSDPPFVPFGFIQAAQASELSAVIDVSRNIIPVDHVIIVGDINSGPTDGIFRDPFFPEFGEVPEAPNWETEINLYPPYIQFTNGVNLFGLDPSPPEPFLERLTDAWDGAPDDLPGFSCCQGIPEDQGGEPGNLLNHKSNLDERIDVIFSIEPPNKVKKARVLGAKVADKTAAPDEGGLWPSDHGSVAAELQF